MKKLIFVFLFACLTSFVLQIHAQVYYQDTKSHAVELVDTLLAKHHVVVFSKSYCPYCKKAKSILNEYNPTDMFVLELDTLASPSDASSIQDYLAKISDGRRTVPRVFIDGSFVGGADDTQRLHEENKLSTLLLKKKKN